MQGLTLARIIATSLALAFATPAASQDVRIGRTVGSLIEFARGRNPDYAAIQAEAEAAAERIAPAGALPDPRFRVELRDITKFGEQYPSLTPSRVGSTKYLLSQELPWFGKRDLKREVAELEAASARSKSSGTWAEIAARIKTNYAQLYYLHHNELLTREVLDLMRRLEKLAQMRYSSGLSPLQDVIRSQVEQTRLRSELLALETEQHHLHSRLNALLGRPAAAPLEEPEGLRPLPAPPLLDYAALAERVRERNPLLAADTSRLQAAEKSRELTYRNRYPDITVGAGPIQYQSAIREWEVMVELNIPLQQSSRRSQEREAEALLAAARARRDAGANQALADLAENLAGIDAARRSEALATDDLLPAAELTFKAALAGYETGKLDFATLLDAQRQIRQARQERIKAQAEGQARLAEIERLVGEDL
ncbi:MAG TPA: TolC family protein [Accumulibacter sp.]|uniref:TolC family protein n=1 Tax=Accumulibacter sp. TaxID=2053492 RepID=UPI0025CF58CB|nr:TolC family protein [Accumulibacter sp.]MCM8598158.1 TolC family protein [Accumulibacter sp.]MCM8662378.1 TolC family protein [Accumulibacter sp.]HNC52444.1 TolC family protein [Accumulibacter sp.]